MLTATIYLFRRRARPDGRFAFTGAHRHFNSPRRNERRSPLNSLSSLDERDEDVKAATAVKSLDARQTPVIGITDGVS
jgi:hypothetical protein